MRILAGKAWGLASVDFDQELRRGAGADRDRLARRPRSRTESAADSRNSTSIAWPGFRVVAFDEPQERRILVGDSGDAQWDADRTMS